MSILSGRRSRVVAGVILSALAAALFLSQASSAAVSGGWHNLGHGATATSAPLDSQVHTITQAGSLLYFGGDFTNAGGIAAADGVAVWNGSTWSAVGAGITAGSVNAIAVDGSHVYVGGTMTFAGALGQTSVAIWDGAQWTTFNSISLNGSVFALAIVGRTLYIGGAFLNAGGIASADYIVAVNLDTGTSAALASNDGDINGTISSITPDGAGGIWVGGSFINADQVAAADHIAHYSGGVWSSLGDNGASNGAIDATVRGIAATSTDVYAVGDFTNVAGTDQADHVARYNVASDTWFKVGPPGFFTALDVPLYSVAVDGSSVFVGGTMIDGGGMAKLDGIAAFTGTTWTNVGTSADGTNGPASGSIRALWIAGGKLFAGGLDSAIGGGSQNAYAAWFAERQPDAEVARATGAFVGAGVYGTTTQRKSTATHRGTRTTFRLRFGNDGFISDRFLIKGPGSRGGFTATYLDGTRNVTARVVAGTYSTGGLAPGATKTLRLRVAVRASVAIRASRSWTVRQSIDGATGPSDPVTATVTVN